MNSDFRWDDLLDDIESDKVVPILGQELIQADYEGRCVSLQRLLAERLADREQVSVTWNPYAELNDAIGACLEKPEVKLAGLYDRVSNLLRSLSPPFPIPRALTQLAEIPPLELFVSLTFDSLMARALNEVRFNGKSITREIEFSLNQSSAAHDEARVPRSSAAPVVFNLFGRAGGKSDFAIHDEDQLEFIHRFVTRDEAPEWLLSELRNSHLLLLGAHFPDWLGRFILRAATRDRLRVASRSYYTAGETATSENALAEFLHRFGRETQISIYAGPAAAFVAELHERWLKRNPATSRRPAARPDGEAVRGGIFISYGRENLNEVERLHAAIVKLGGDAWFDKVELKPGDHWEQKILPQIQRDVRLFLPVFSERTVDRLSAEGYVFREWNEALERKQRIPVRTFIMPIVIDTDYTGDMKRYRPIFDAFPGMQDLHMGYAPGGLPDEELEKMLVDEIRGMRREDSR
ncbi:hypothetical protein CUJ88_36735 [Paraburkholderia hospita]|jgi:hypothetical protein|uniref:TIR domain-containing protein n=1 Tax=Paraburkholderia hospita TaxID=169430 RepID=A0AAJ4STU2_9BURK|nr:toll/interleukin-1 receptor domain-containing protein [Paraburkholderia hospita]AUT74390.1 TIR domain-containing protein [Paraburkholderia hospita]AXF04022.1 hypothetical protein CUJ88_36735 [Paraburkholderia hospita]EIM99298.1 TIR protein [Paraburkholderia hospita]OUL78431.1 hypothetical protein CA602_31800 [Paraburkholderia hospita]OUL96717.1 hypothetical protein CA603_04620 [Paraburkholderia hospita]